MVQHIVLFGAGKSATVLINYLIQQAATLNWQIHIIDNDEANILQKTNNSQYATPHVINIETDTEKREAVIANAAIVLSLLPASLHILVAKDCIKYKKNLLTASYIDEAIKALKSDIESNDLLFLYEMGLDPGIDHISAMQMIDTIKNEGGEITSFKSHCGGLVSPECDDNPWHYKISWNPRNVVTAGKVGALYLQNGEKITVPYTSLFSDAKLLDVDTLSNQSYYPNRDSLSYIPLYNLPQVHTFIRTTIRHFDFMYGWNNIIELGFTNEEKTIQTDGKTLEELFKLILDSNDFGNWVSNKMSKNLATAKTVLLKLQELIEAEAKQKESGKELVESMLTVNEKGNLENIHIDDIKLNGAEILAHCMHQNNLIMKQLHYLGLGDTTTVPNLGICSPADILQYALETKLKLQPTDKDMIVMLHEIEYIKLGKKYRNSATLIVHGNDAQHTAMAKTVGLPLGIAATLILNKTITGKGLQLPIVKNIYEPVLAILKENGISFVEKTIEL